MSVIHKIVGLPLWMIFIGLMGFMFYSCYWIGTTMCGNYIHQEYPSSDGSWKAVVFQRDCGATTWFSTQISILPASSELANGKGNIFIIDGHPEVVAPSLDWIANDKLRIGRKLDGKEHKAKTNYGWFNKVEIVYD